MTDLFVGASKGLAKSLAQTRADTGHEILHISSAESADNDSVRVDWTQVQESDLHRFLMRSPKIDLVFFNQNGSSLSASSFQNHRYETLDLWKQIAHWRQSYFVSCQLPFQVIHSLGDRLDERSRVCWMLSSMVVRHCSDAGYADYIGNKFQNYLIMKNFARAHRSCFFGIDPGDLNDGNDENKLSALLELIDRPVEITNGRVFDSKGSPSALYEIFDQ